MNAAHLGSGTSGSRSQQSDAQHREESLSTSSYRTGMHTVRRHLLVNSTQLTGACGPSDAATNNAMHKWTSVAGAQPPVVHRCSIRSIDLRYKLLYPDESHWPLMDNHETRPAAAAAGSAYMPSAGSIRGASSLLRP